MCRITDPFADAVKTDHSYYHICKRRDHRLMNSRHFKGSAPGSVSFHKKKITKAGQLFQDLFFGAGNLWLPGLVMSRDDVSVLFYKPACSRNVLCLRKRTFRFPCHMRGCGHDHTFSLSGKYFCQSKDQTGLSATSCECHSKRFFIYLLTSFRDTRLCIGHRFSFLAAFSVPGSTPQESSTSSTPPAIHLALSEIVKQFFFCSALGSMSAIFIPSKTG